MSRSRTSRPSARPPGAFSRRRDIKSGRRNEKLLTLCSSMKALNRKEVVEKAPSVSSCVEHFSHMFLLNPSIQADEANDVEAPKEPV